jgi:E3 ubiquitin-protein ligase HUWE1
MQDSQVVAFFWRYVGELSDAERLVLLRWMSGLFCLPPGGFSGLPRFKISKDYGSLDRLPSVSTCSFSLYLPESETFDQLASKLRQASQDFTFGRV